VCGAGVQAHLSLVPEAGSCPDPDYQWRQVSGPALLAGTDVGPEVNVASLEQGFDSLVGESLVFEIAADAGVGNTHTVQRSVLIGAPAFVAVTRMTDSPAPSDSVALRVQLQLRNTSDRCGASGVSFVEQLDGLTYVEGSARGPLGVSASATAEGLRFDGLSIAARETASVSYSAVPRMFLQARPQGVAVMGTREIPISEASGFAAPIASSCGCGTQGGGPVGFALIALIGDWLRRRGRGQTSQQVS
jgi:uncharacterized protein (TIGR03382 family)